VMATWAIAVSADDAASNSASAPASLLTTP
jgi:hypothetical protein